MATNNTHRKGQARPMSRRRGCFPAVSVSWFKDWLRENRSYNLKIEVWADQSKCRRRRHNQWFERGSGGPGLFPTIFGVRPLNVDTKKISNFWNDIFRFFCPKCLSFAKMLDLPPLPEPAESTKIKVRGIYSPGPRNVLQMAPVWRGLCDQPFQLSGRAVPPTPTQG